jgi:hypothetical protein
MKTSAEYKAELRGKRAEEAVETLRAISVAITIKAVGESAEANLSDDRTIETIEARLKQNIDNAVQIYCALLVAEGKS